MNHAMTRARHGGNARPTGQSRRARRAASVLALSGGVVLAAVPTPGATADGLLGSSLSNVATADATATFPTVSQLAYQVRTTFTPAIAPDNVARASATDCTGCQAVAAAFQIVVAGRVSVLSPSNLATATEISCTQCAVTALADQWVVASTSNHLLLTPAGRIALAAVHLQLLALTSNAASATDLTAEAAPLVAEIDAILANDITVVPPAPGAPGAPGADRASAPGSRDGWRLRDARAAVGGRSVTVLPERGYTVYFSTQVNSSGTSPAAPSAPTPSAPSPAPGGSQASRPAAKPG